MATYMTGTSNMFTFYVFNIKRTFSVSHEIACRLSNFLTNTRTFKSNEFLEEHKILIARLLALCDVHNPDNEESFIVDTFHLKENWEHYSHEDFISYLKRFDYLLKEGMDVMFALKFAKNI